MPVHLPPFDPSRDFVAQRVFRCQGTIYTRREAFPKDSVDGRLLEKLYTNRQIGYAEDEQVRAAPVSPKARARKERVEEAGRKGDETPPEDEIVISDEAKAYAGKKGHTHDFLFQKASGLAGVTKSMSKGQIAQKLLDAGRAGDDGTA